jgi:hypothetical protein
VAKALVLGGVVALATKPEVRNRLLDMLFGPEEQFEYDSVTEPAATPIIADQGGDAGAAGSADTGARDAWRTAEGDPSPTSTEEPPTPPFDSWTAPAAERDVAPAPAPPEPAPPEPAPPEPMPSFGPSAPLGDPWSPAVESAALPEEAPTVVHEPWTPDAQADAAPEGEPPPAEETSSPSGEAPTVVHEPWLPGGDASAAAPEGEPTAVDETWSRSAETESGAGEQRTVVEESWSRSGETAAAPQGDASAAYQPWSRSEEPAAALEDEPSVAYEPWSPREESAVAREDEPELIVHQEATWLSSPAGGGDGGDGTTWVEPSEDFEGDDFEAERSEASAVSTLDQAEPAGEESIAPAVEETPDEAETETPQEQQPKPAIGEAESPRSGWWMPRRRRPTGGTREPPRWD